MKTDKKEVIAEFDDIQDFILSSITVALLQVSPNLSDKEVILQAQGLAKKIYAPNSAHIWRRPISRIRRVGLRAIASRIRRQLYELL